MSQGDLARATEIAATQLSRYETGRAVPRKLAVHRLATALAVNWRWLEYGEGEIGEYGSVEGSGLSIWIDAELRDRLTAYAYYNGLTLEEAMADILDSPLMAYSKDELPKTPEAQDRLRQTLKAYATKGPRLKVLARKLRVAPSGPPQPTGPRITEKEVNTMPVLEGGSRNITTEITEQYKVRHRDERDPRREDRAVPVTVIKKRTFVRRGNEPKS